MSASATSHADAIYTSYARPLGATLVGFGMAVLVLGESLSLSFPLISPSGLTMRRGPPVPGTRRYFLVQRALPQGLFPAARLSIFLQAVSLATLVGIVFGILVAVR